MGLRAHGTGRLVADPEQRFLPNGTAVATFRMAFDTGTKNKPETTFLTASVFGQRAEAVVSYLAKGRKILVDGRLNNRSYEAPDGSKRTALDLTVDEWEFCDSKPKADSDEQPWAWDEKTQTRIEGEIPF